MIIVDESISVRKHMDMESKKLAGDDDDLFVEDENLCATPFLMPLLLQELKLS